MRWVNTTRKNFSASTRKSFSASTLPFHRVTFLPPQAANTELHIAMSSAEYPFKSNIFFVNFCGSLFYFRVARDLVLSICAVKDRTNRFPFANPLLTPPRPPSNVKSFVVAQTAKTQKTRVTLLRGEGAPMASNDADVYKAQSRETDS